MSDQNKLEPNGSTPPAKKVVLPPRPAAGPRSPAAVPSPSATASRPPTGATLPPPVGRIVGGDGGPDRLTAKDFKSDQDVRWCPGCGDYAILAAVQRLMPELNVPRQDTVFISGIGCSSRFPYYMNTYGMHSIHGRAPAIATGLKSSRPELDVWVVTGDGDALSIGGNHLIHAMRRNVNLQILLFNNQIYGLTKGQYSPTSEIGKVTKSTPYGSIDHPFNPLSIALGAEASFVARSMDRDPKHLKDILKRAHEHNGTSFVEIYQNCNIFNDGAFFQFTERDTKTERTIFLEHGKPMLFENGRKGIRLDGFKLQVVDLEAGGYGVTDCIVYDETSLELAQIVSRMFWQPEMPRPFGVFYRHERPAYDELMQQQIEKVTETRKTGNLQALLQSGDTWTIE